MYIRSNGIFSGITGYKFVIVEMVGVKFSPNIVYLLSILLRELISFANLILSLSLSLSFVYMYMRNIPTWACMRSPFISFISSTAEGKEENHVPCFFGYRIE
jgi:ABC-type uncharacterized transport system fused permease/ATPase subunit